MLMIHNSPGLDEETVHMLVLIYRDFKTLSTTETLNIGQRN